MNVRGMNVGRGKETQMSGGEGEGSDGDGL